MIDEIGSGSPTTHDRRGRRQAAAGLAPASPDVADAAERAERRDVYGCFSNLRAALSESVS